MSTFAWGLLIVLACLVLQAWAGRSRAARLVWGLSCFATPLLFACLCLGTQPAGVDDGLPAGATDYQHSGSIFLTFHGLRRPMKGDFRIGGSDGSDFLLERLPDRGDVAVIDENGVLRAAAIVSKGEHYAAARGSLRDLSRQGSLPTWALRAGSTLCLAPPGTTSCAAVGNWRWLVQAEGQLVVSSPAGGQREEQQACRLSRFVNSFGWQARLGRVPTAQDRIFPLDIYGRPGCAGGAVELEAESALERTFFHFDEQGRLFVTQLPASGGDVLVVEGAEQVRAAGDRATPYEVTVFRMQASTPLPQMEVRRRLWNDSYAAESGRSRLLRIGTLEVAFLTSAIQATFPDTIQVTARRPAVVEVPPTATCRQSTIVNLMGVHERSRSAPEDTKLSEATARVPFLADLGRIGASGAMLEVRRDNVEVSPWQAHGCRSYSRADLRLDGATGSVEHVQGPDVLSLGSPGGAQLLMSAAEYGVPAQWIAGLMLAFALLRCLLRMACWQSLVQAPLLSAVLVVVDTLLVIRLVVAVQEIAVQPHLDSKVVPALLAVLLLPLALELMIVILHRLFRRRSPEGARVRLSAPAWVTRTLIPSLLLCLPVLHLVLVGLGFREQVAGGRITTFFVPAYVLLLAALASAAAVRRPTNWIERFPAVLLAVSMVLVLLAFWIANDKGAVIALIGAFIALSLMAVFARRPPGRRMRRPAAALAFAAVALLALAVVAATLLYAGRGSLADVRALALHPALLGWSMLALALAVLYVLRARTWTAGLFAAPGLLVVLILAALSTARFERGAVDCSVGDVVQVATCLDAQSLETNRLRLAYLIYPALSRLNVAGEARGMNAVFDELHWVTNDFPAGGLMSVPPRMGLDQHDNAIATHLIAPQGRSSAWLLGAIIALPLLLLVMAGRHRRLGLRWPLPWLAYGCFAFTSIYMILGNLMLVPFTGRNVYLTNAFSGADALEGGLLIVVSLVPLVACRGGRVHGRTVA